MGKGTLYAAYGSNLDVGQMSYRCPNAHVYGAGRVEGYRLAFKALGSSAYATIEPCEGSFVPVLLWQLSASDEARLDRYEGYPTHYHKGLIGVSVGEELIEAMLYIMDGKARPAEPSRVYYSVLYQGYQNFGFDMGGLAEALAVSRGMEVENPLQFYRREKGLTQRQLAALSGVSEGLVQKYETGEREIGRCRVDIALRLATALNIPVYRIVRKGGFRDTISG